MSIAAIGRINTPARSRALAATASIHQSTHPPILHQPAALCRCQPRLYSISPAAVGGGLITSYVIYLLSHPIARIGSNPSTFAALIDLYRTKGGTEIPGDAATPAAAASAYQAIAICPVNLHNDPTTASVSTPASYHKRYKNTVKRRRFFQRRKSIVYFAQPIPGLMAAPTRPPPKFPFK